jgi:anti-sigma factor RsiW
VNHGAHVEAALPAFLDGRLTPAERARIERHLADCAGCRQAAEAYRAVGRRLDEDVAAEPLASMWPAIAQRRDPRRRAADLAFAFGATAALAAGFALGLGATGDHWPPAVTPRTAGVLADSDGSFPGEQTLSDVYFFDAANGVERTQ